MINFLLSKTGLYVVLGIVLLVVIGVVEVKVYNAGYNKADIMYKALIAKEDARQQEVQDKILNKQKEIINGLENTNKELETKLKENESEASKDPNHSRHALGKSSVMRIDAIH